MRVFVTGGGGFVGGAVVARLIGRGDEVTCVIRDPTRARPGLAGVVVVGGDLSDTAELERQIAGHDAVIHVAGSYRVGIRPDERSRMWDSNVAATERVLDAAIAAGVPRVVYVSTVNVVGNTRGQVVDESYRRELGEGFLTWYDETKFRAHEVAEQRSAGGAPIVIVMPSQVYGPGDHSTFGEQLRRANEGRLPYRVLDDVGVGMVHVDDLATGILAALDHGRVGESYILSGPRTRLRAAMALAAAIAGRRLPRIRLPTGLLRLLAPVGRLIGQPNLRELISGSAGVTHWASSDKAERELGFRARDLETGFRDTFTAR